MEDTEMSFLKLCCSEDRITGFDISALVGASRRQAPTKARIGNLNFSKPRKMGSAI